MTTVADQMVETLHAAGGQRIYGIVGDSLNGFTDSLRRHGKIQWLHVRDSDRAGQSRTPPPGPGRDWRHIIRQIADTSVCGRECPRRLLSGPKQMRWMAPAHGI
jgi:hypothetical protein